MDKYLKLKCIDCNYEKMVLVQNNEPPVCPICGRSAVMPSQKSLLIVKVEEVIALYGREILKDLPRFCDLVEKKLADENYYFYAWEVENFNDLRQRPYIYRYLLNFTQREYDQLGRKTNPLIEAIYEALGIETLGKRERKIAYVIPTPTIPVVVNGVIYNQKQPVPKAKKSKKATPPPTAHTPPTPPPAAAQPKSEHKRFLLPKGSGASVNCTVDASIPGWEKGNYVVRIRSGYPCTYGENPKDGVLEIARVGNSGSVTVKTGYVDTVRRIGATDHGFFESSLLIEFKDGTEGLLVSLHRRERKELERLVEIARHNGKT